MEKINATMKEKTTTIEIIDLKPLLKISNYVTVLALMLLFASMLTRKITKTVLN